ncbi:MAG: hypothetical protein CMI17_04040 [Opitutaceae bacterium]|nr:hypothetical protein [Opitutaceae bacterium]
MNISKPKMLFKKTFSPKDDERLSHLIQLKRQEKPDEAFWLKFDEEIRSKQLAALVRPQSWYDRVGKLSILIARKSAAATATASILALGIFTVSETDYFTGGQTTKSLSQTEPMLPTADDASAIDQPIFVVNDLHPQAEANEVDFSYGINATPSYEINALTKKSVPIDYQIISEPKQFTAGHINSGTDLGAKVIGTWSHF